MISCKSDSRKELPDEKKKTVQSPYVHEIIRSETASEAEKAEAEKKMNELFALVPVPDGARDFKMDALH